MNQIWIALALLSLGCKSKPVVTEVGTEWQVPPAPYTAALNTMAPMPADCVGVQKPYSSELMYGGVICSNQCSPRNIKAGESFTCPSFGGVMTAITDWQDGPWVHGYSLPSAHSASNRWVNLTGHDAHQNFDLLAKPPKPYAVPASNNAVMWDSKTDDTYYYISGTRVMARSMRYFADAVVYDFAGKLTSPQTGGSTHIAGDYLSVWGPQEHTLCAVNLIRQRSYCADYSAPHPDSRVGWDFIDFILTTPTDPATQRQYVLLAASPAVGLWSINEATGVLDYEGRGPERRAVDGYNNSWGNQDGICDPNEPCLVAYHLDATVLAGKLWLFTATDMENPCERQLQLLPLLPLSRAFQDKRPLLPIALCSTNFEWPEMHFGCSYETGACVVSTATSGQAPYGNQILLLRDASHITRLAYTYSKKGPTDTYWWYPRAAISGNGKFIVFDSTWGRADAGNGMSGEQPFQLGPISPMPRFQRSN